MKKKSLVLALALTGLALAGCNDPAPQSSDSEESESSLPSQSTPSGDTESSESSPIESSETDSDSQTSSSSPSESEVESGDSAESSDSSSDSSSEDSTDSSSSSSSSSDSTSSSSEEPNEPVVVGDVTFDGVGNATIKAGQYFDVFEGVTAHDTNEADLTDRIVCKGHVNYGGATRADRKSVV